MPKSKTRKNKSKKPHKSMEQLMLAHSGKNILNNLTRRAEGESFIVSLVLNDGYEDRPTTSVKRTDSEVEYGESNFPTIFSSLLGSGLTFAVIMQSLTEAGKNVQGWLVDSGKITALKASEVEAAVVEDQLYDSPLNVYRDAFSLL